MSNIKFFAVFGNPIAHSKSPRIHALFSEQTGIELAYERILAPVADFEKSLRDYFEAGAYGANITAPFKERACAEVDALSERASFAKAVNTIKKMDNGELYGDNTDGIGLLSDLKHRDLIQPQSRILLIGAGGATRGVIQPLLSHGCSLVLTNRTLSKATVLAEHFSSLGNIAAVSMHELNDCVFDLVINATSSGITGDIPALPASLISQDICCYDMFYLPEPTPFLKWCLQHGAQHCSDGLGMLIWQAAHAFQLWHGVMPNVVPVIQQMKQELAS
ncbi:shikimate dehydrogenase [Prodigiosinella confusarubida]|uniref:Shikimate dehydrogenase (NADP(+)) n=1 Tax=Serratia sp. (strain ATCC 39006) TaxID=104623 RepID=A0A2I5TCV7_SERS3|nr:shikimate dehydrogenase [Serratia sp. ATCC 39006]AUH02407.1 shikimate dehydrogenase [Serratia sp. ATCC 39006]AUH06728.1 shikimate dehydrogenase [Serratia sp. ATCC 39006]